MLSTEVNYLTMKAAIMVGLILGSTLGGWLPSLVGADMFSAWSIVGSTVGSLIGIYFGYKIGSEYM